MDISKLLQASRNGASGFWQKFQKKSNNGSGGNRNDDDTEEAPGDVRLNAGSRNKTPVVKRGFILACMGLASTVLVYAYFSSEDAKTPRSVPIQQELINSHQPAQNNSKELDYSALKDADINKFQQQQGNHGATPPKPAAQRQAPTLPSLPKIPQVGALNNIPDYLLPNKGGAVPTLNLSREKTEEERYQSAIAFYNSNEGKAGSAESTGKAGSVGQGFGHSKNVSYTAPSSTIVQAGTLIPAMLFSGINTDSSGQVTAVIQSDIFDSATGQNLLIPAGSQVIGKYDGGAAKNGRVTLAFSVIVLPNGGSYALNNDCIMAVDGAGYNGIKGKVHHHTDKAIRGGLFASTIAALGSIAAGNVNNNSNTYSAGQLAMQGAMANVMNSASNMFANSSNNVTETVTIPPGYQFNLYVTQPISF